MNDELQNAFDALRTYDWGTDVALVAPIDDAIASTRDDAARKTLAARLAAVLKMDVSRDAKDFVCRKLTVIGSAACVPALAALLPDANLSHMARYALERIPSPEAAQALRDGLPKLAGALKIGVLGSLGVRRDTASVPALAALLADSDVAIVNAAACAMGDIGDAHAAKALRGRLSQATNDEAPAIIDALLVCAERLLADGDKAEATAIYKSLLGEGRPKLVRLAATRGLLAVAAKKD